jgi:hypothetical protein
MIAMGLYKWFRSRPGWARHAILGALAYPSIILAIFFLAFVTTPIGLRPAFESIMSWILYPAYYPSLAILYRTTDYPNSYLIYFMGLVTFFSAAIGSAAGVMVFLIRNGYRKIRPLGK